MELLILFAGYELDDIIWCKELIKSYYSYVKTADISSKGQGIRKKLTDLFYGIYERAFSVQQIQENPMFRDIFAQSDIIRKKKKECCLNVVKMPEALLHRNYRHIQIFMKCS